jgi:hypothetical protein
VWHFSVLLVFSIECPRCLRRYTEHEFDSEFIEALREACFRYIDRQGDATLTDIASFIASKGFSKVDLREEDVLSIVNTLVYDGRVDAIEDSEDIDHFRPAMLSIPKQSAFTSVPCGVCPVSKTSWSCVMSRLQRLYGRQLIFISHRRTGV